MDTSIKLSASFRLDEFLRSQTATRHGIDLTPPPQVVDNLSQLCVQLLQPIRDALGPVYISSGYRSTELNRLIGGSNQSQHLTGQAADFVVAGRTPLEVCKAIENSLLPFDQCIHEFGSWVHLSVAIGQPPRRELLTAYKKEGRTRYAKGIYPATADAIPGSNVVLPPAGKGR